MRLAQCDLQRHWLFVLHLLQRPPLAATEQVHVWDDAAILIYLLTCDCAGHGLSAACPLIYLQTNSYYGYGSRRLLSYGGYYG